MDETDKVKFDRFRELEKASWEEFQEKTRLEWRFSFALWGAILTAIGSIFVDTTVVDIHKVNECLIYFLCIVLIIVHFTFLCWIQEKLQSTRAILHSIRTKMYKILDQNTELPLKQGKCYFKPSLWIQIIITIFLSLIILGIYYH